MNKDGFGLAQAPLPLRDGQEPAAAGQHLPFRRHSGNGGGVAAGVHADDDAFHCAASFLRRMVPRTPLTKRPEVGSE